MSSPSADTSKLSKRIELVFSRFAAFYGHVWRSQFKSEHFLVFVKKEWEAGLQVFSDATIEQAILHCRDFLEMPPTLPQLIGQCKAIEKRKHFFVAKEDVGLAAPETVASHLQQCREFLI